MADGMEHKHIYHPDTYEGKMERAIDALEEQVADLQSRLSAAEKERDGAIAHLQEVEQAITDPENQPSQFGTVTLDYHNAALSQLRQEIRSEAVEDAAKFCEMFERGDGIDFAREIRRLAEQEKHG